MWSCVEFPFGKNTEEMQSDLDPFTLIHRDEVVHILEWVDFFTLSRYLRRQYWNHILPDTAWDVLRTRLMPTSGDIKWFDTFDADRVFESPLKIRRFFDVMREFYPDFDLHRANFELGMERDIPPQLREFLWELRYKARHALLYFFAADSSQLAFIYFTMYKKNSITLLEEAMHRTIWRTFDSAKVDRTRDFRIAYPAASEMYVVFPMKVNAKDRERVHSMIEWSTLDRLGYSRTVVRSPYVHDYSRLVSSFANPFEAGSMVFADRIPYELFVDGELQELFPVGE